MNKCKGCAHYEACVHMGSNITKTRMEAETHECIFFKDKALLLEPEAKIGDLVFYIDSNKFCDNEITFSIRPCRIIDIQCFLYSQTYTYHLKEADSPYFHYGHIGEDAFLEFEQAENKFKELTKK